MNDDVEKSYTNSIPNESRRTSLEMVFLVIGTLRYSFSIKFVDSVVQKLMVKSMDPIQIFRLGC